MKRSILLRFATVVMLSLMAAHAHAACSSPTADEGALAYASNLDTVVYCDGTNWVTLNGNSGTSAGVTTLDGLSDVNTSGVSNGQVLVYNGGTWSPGSAQDSRIGTLGSTGQWCTTDGSVINCSTAAPVTTEVDPEVDTLTASNFCQVNAGGTAIACGSNASTHRTALGLGTSDAPSFAGITATNVTATTALSAAALCDENGANCVDVSSGFGSSSAQGDRVSTTGVASGVGLAMVATDGNIISFTTSGVNTSYLDSAGKFIGPGVSITTTHGISSTHGYFSGNVGIGTPAPAAALHVVGDVVYTGVMSDVSDRRMKRDILPLQELVAEQLMLLKPVTFRMKDEDRREYGFIAQDVQNVFPELVVDGNPLSLNYVGLIAPAVKTIQLLKRQNEEQGDRIDALAEQNRLLRAQFKDLVWDLRRTQRELARFTGQSDLH